MKRLFSFMMVLVLLLALSVSAFAASDGSITVTNAKAGETYTVYKIFDAALTEDENGISYTVVPGSALAAEMFGAGGTGANYFTYDTASGAVALKADVSESDLFTYLKSLANKQQIGEPITAASATVEFTNLPFGYYLIGSTLGATVSIDSTNPHADVIDKNQPTVVDKQVKLRSDAEYDADDSISAGIGDTLDFKVEFTALNYRGNDKVEKYSFEDTLNPTGWAAIDFDSIEIKIDGNALVKDTDWTLKSSNADGFELEIPWQNAEGEFLYAPSAEVEISYCATVLDAAAAATPTGNENTAELKWADTASEDTTTTWLYNMGFTKVDGADATKKLPGAKFALYSNSDCTLPVNVKTTGTDGVYMVDQTSSSNVVETFEDGQVVIMGLKEGTYYLKELEAPDGYNLMIGNKEILVDGSIENTEPVKTSYTVHNADLDIENNKGLELPSTGGKGTMMLITFGFMVAMAFAVLLITHKKMSVYHD